MVNVYWGELDDYLNKALVQPALTRGFYRLVASCVQLPEKQDLVPALLGFDPPVPEGMRVAINHGKRLLYNKGYRGPFELRADFHIE